MKSYIVYYIQANLLGLKRLAVYNKSFLLDLLADLVSIVLALLFYRILYLNIGEGLRISIEDLYILVLSVKLTGDLYNLLFGSGVHSLPSLIQYGGLDSILIKPMNVFFILFCSNLNWKCIVNLIIDLMLFMVIIMQYNIIFSVQSLCMYIVMIGLATVVYTAFNILIFLGSIVFVRMDAFSSLISSFFSLSTYPAAIFKASYLKWIFIYVIPVLVIGNFPLMAMKGGYGYHLFVSAGICALIFTIGAYWGTSSMLRHYKSASS